MKMKKIILMTILGIILVAGFVKFTYAETSYCCEKTTEGAWCQNALENTCDGSFRKAPTSCEATSYCKLGTCIDSEEGTCMENTPQKVCEEEKGVWYDKPSDEITQCGLGCCLIGDQAAFVTQTRCKRLSALYGLNTNFRTDIQDEFQCIATATSEVMGACIFEKEFEKTCLFISKKECSDRGDTSFYEGDLCSSEALGTNCGPSKKTTCVEGRDQVYFIDTCGNLANVYDSSKLNDKEYWATARDVSESCGYGSSNADSSSCGNCDYYLGSTCKIYKTSQDKSKPAYGDNVCRDLSCMYEGKKYKHGETWCFESKGTEENLPGSRHFRMVCYNGEVSVEPCTEFRQEVCLESDIDGFSTAACRVNKWQDCTAQKTAKECENTDRRDCLWMTDLCVPRFAPGFNFWDSEGESEEICAQATAECTVVYEKGISGGKVCIENCHCLTEAWKNKMNQICTSLGDCGSSNNYFGFKGYNSISDLYSITSG